MLKRFPIKLISLFLPSLILFACEDELREVPIMEEAKHCYNEAFDEGESWYNCGDECATCKMKTPPCDPPDNELKLNGNVHAIDSMTFHLDRDDFENEGVTAYFDGGNDLEIRVYSPKSEYTHEAECNSSIYKKEARLKLYGSKACSGGVYLGTQNGDRYVIACNAGFQNGNDTLQYFKAVQQ